MDYKWIALTVTTVGTAMSGLDERIVIIGLPAIAQQLHAGADETVWITQAFLLSMTVCMLFIGKMADTFGRVRLYTYGFVIFTAGSIFCAVATSSTQLIAFRVVQGVGAGIIVPSSAAVVTDASPPKELGTMIGINQAAFRVGNVFGLTLSGVILSLVDWRGLFYVNIPIGIFATIWAYKRLREISPTDKSRKIDWPGFVLFSAGLTLALLAITFFSYGISGTLIGYAFLFAGIALLVSFMAIESKVAYPMLDLQLFRIWAFAAGSIAQFLNSVGWYGITLLLVFYLQIGLGYQPLEAGLGILPIDAAFLVSSLVCGKLSDRYGTRTLTILGHATNAIAFLAVSTFGERTPYLEVGLVLLVIGFANGMFNTPNTKAILASVPGNRRGIAAAFRSMMFNLGGAMSYGLVLLLLTVGISYSSFTMLLQSNVAQAAVAGARLEFLNGFRITAIAFAGVIASAILCSLLRERKQE
jgi:EmrB/QacA subfamily drug resistance transporter